MTRFEFECDMEEFRRALIAASKAVKDFTESLDAKSDGEDDA